MFNPAESACTLYLFVCLFINYFIVVQVQLVHGELSRAEEASIQVQEAAPVGTQGRQQLQGAAAQEAGGGLHCAAARPGVSSTRTHIHTSY